jgi:integrase
MTMTNLVLMKNKSVYDEIMTFINKKFINSENTASEYERDIRQFFNIMRNKTIEHLTENDLIFKNSDIEFYQTRLATDLNSGSPYSPSTVNRKIATLKSLYNKLESNDYLVKSAWFNIDKVKGDSESYGIISLEEANKMIELVRNTKKGDIKSLLVEIAFKTSFRQNALLNLKWKDIKKINNVWVIQVVDKGKSVAEKPINDETYQRLLEIRSEERVFPLTKKTVINMMKWLREEMGLESDITFHSLKKGGIDQVAEITDGNFEAMKEQGNHKSLETTMKYYRNKKKDFSNMACLQIGKDLEFEVLESLNKEQLLELIKVCNRGVQIQIINKAKDLI